MIIAIVSYDEDRAIAKDGKIPWHIPEDLQHFQKTTTGCPVIMGRKTWDSLPNKPLPQRTNVVISRHPHDIVYFDPSEPFWASSLKAALRLISHIDPDNDVFIIGGEQIYQEAMGMVQKVIASEVKGRFGGDKFFPELPGWKATIKKQYEGFVVKEYVK